MNFHVPHKNEQHTPSPVALAARLADLQNFTNSELCARRVIALPRLYFDITLGFDGNLAESAIAFLVGWCIAQQILRAQLGSDLVESLPQFVELIVYFEDPPTGLLRQVFHDALSAAAINSRGEEKHIADGVGLLCRFNGLAEPSAAAFIHTVGHDDERLSPNLAREFVMRSQIDGIEERGSGCVSAGRGRPLRKGRNLRLHAHAAFIRRGAKRWCRFSKVL